MRLDPEEHIIAAALDEAELDDVKERGAGARIEFRREGHARETITISRELVERARALDLTTGELFAEAIRIAAPGAFDAAGQRSNGGTIAACR
jgi:post-segregation antitoxin (ccd killing protein)